MYKYDLSDGLGNTSFGRIEADNIVMAMKKLTKIVAKTNFEVITVDLKEI